MGLQIPNLDQKEFDTRIKEAVAKLPAYAKEWTEYNYSDPGITIIELLAWMADINSYRLNRIREEHYEAFLELLSDHEKKQNPCPETFEETVSGTTELGDQRSLYERFSEIQQTLKTPCKAVTLSDYEYLTLQHEGVAKAKAKADVSTNKVSVIVVPEGIDSDPKPSNSMKTKIKAYLQERALLTTEVVTKSPEYTLVNVQVKVQTRYQDPNELRNTIRTALEAFFHPVNGGNENKGWAFGEDMHISEVYMLLNDIEGIDRIDSIYFSGEKTTVEIDANVLPRSGSHVITVTSIQPLGSCL